MISKKTVFAVAAAAVMALPVTATSAQAQKTMPQTGYTQQSGADATKSAIDPKAMEEFAKVHPEVEKVNREYAEKITAEKNVDDRNALAAEANKEIEELVKGSDLSIQEYNRIAMLIQQDANAQVQYHRALKK